MSPRTGDQKAGSQRNETGPSDTLIEAIHRVAPGTALREGIDQIVQSQTGGLIVCGDYSRLALLCSGGIKINVEYSPSLLYQLAKMDGAIICDRDARRILGANVQLTPDPTIASAETGTRHRTADRVSKQTDALVVTVSARRESVTLYYGGQRHHLTDISMVLSKANQGLATLDRYRERFNSVDRRLDAAEAEGRATLDDALVALQRAELAVRMARLVANYVIELGTEGRMIELQLEDATHDLLARRAEIVRTWAFNNTEQDAIHAALLALRRLSDADVLEPDRLARALGYEGGVVRGVRRMAKASGAGSASAFMHK
jgi:diadenylate cyclase